MFTIEFAFVRGRSTPGVIETILSEATHIDAATALANAQLPLVRQCLPDRAPDGFQIKDASGEIRLRSWVRSA